MDGHPAMTTIPTFAGAAAERRRGPRLRVLLSGKIVARNGVTCDCRIHNHGPDGARLKLASDYVVGDDFHLIEVTAGVARLCRVVWRRLPEVGVRFLESWDLRAPCPKQIEPVKRIWLDSAARDSPGCSPLDAPGFKPAEPDGA